jgi:hypothetical protein
VTGSARSSFHSTLNVLKGLLYFEAETGSTGALRAARQAGEEYLLQHACPSLVGRRQPLLKAPAR